MSLVKQTKMHPAGINIAFWSIFLVDAHVSLVACAHTYKLVYKSRLHPGPLPNDAIVGRMPQTDSRQTIQWRPCLYRESALAAVMNHAWLIVLPLFLVLCWLVSRRPLVPPLMYQTRRLRCRKLDSGEERRLVYFALLFKFQHYPLTIRNNAFARVARLCRG